MRKIFVLAAMLVASQAQAFSGSLSTGFSDNRTKDKTVESIGLSMSQPIVFGLSWWSWTGVGQNHEKLEPAVRWAQTHQAIDWNFKSFKFTGSAKFQWENDLKDYSPEYGFRVAVKLW
jgi:hypothetical protein